MQGRNPSSLMLFPRLCGMNDLRMNEDPGTSHFMGVIMKISEVPQEEIGTGGGGFRFIYAAFLQEAGRLMGSTRLEEASRMMTEAGDMWRRFASACARACKSETGDFDVAEIAQLVQKCAIQEKHVYSHLKSVKL
jgi:hypothetical protein